MRLVSQRCADDRCARGARRGGDGDGDGAPEMCRAADRGWRSGYGRRKTENGYWRGARDARFMAAVATAPRRARKAASDPLSMPSAHCAGDPTHASHRGILEWTGTFAEALGPFAVCPMRVAIGDSGRRGLCEAGWRSSRPSFHVQGVHDEPKVGTAYQKPTDHSSAVHTASPVSNDTVRTRAACRVALLRI
ncbi:hypothetical protein DENSPDRAFT_144153 [Dentipellis sp. KUC8613]|nr:hypothetical protein DENSPDRAFT_144153 [Dentipellis sp. KUC8613]